VRRRLLSETNLCCTTVYCTTAWQLPGRSCTCTILILWYWSWQQCFAVYGPTAYRRTSSAWQTINLSLNTFKRILQTCYFGLSVMKHHSGLLWPPDVCWRAYFYCCPFSLQHPDSNLPDSWAAHFKKVPDWTGKTDSDLRPQLPSGCPRLYTEQRIFSLKQPQKRR